jgi:ABC transporter substrate binding protein (PQQ-dependent alcohol dehydrogenase system)
LLPWLFCVPALAPAGAAEPPGATTLSVSYVTSGYPKQDFLSLIETQPDDAGEAGAELALKEINLTGRFLGLGYTMDVARLDGSKIAEQGRAVLAKTKIVVADLEPADLLAFADLPEAKDALILDMRTSDDGLRQKNCRRNTFHLLPSTAMRTDALGQYLLAKSWPRWFLLRGTSAGDKAYAEDIRRTAKRYGAKIVDDRSYGYDAGARRVDTGYQQIQTQMPLATRNAPDHDALVVADVADVFGDYLPYATSRARPVVGTQGLVATAWSPGFQEYSALQMQRRFDVAAHRPMLEADYAGWLALRTIGEAAIRSKKTKAIDLADFMRTDGFEVAGFKGQGLTFRRWDQQLRQPVLLATPLMVVSMSPQDAFLHPKFLTDTLGYDEPESQCRFAP